MPKFSIGQKVRVGRVIGEVIGSRLWAGDRFYSYTVRFDDGRAHCFGEVDLWGA
jgi:hypothetical protein